MPSLHFVDEPGFFEHGPQSIEWLRIGTEAVGSRIANFVLSDDQEDPDAPVASLLFLPPNYRLPRHAHACHRAEIIVRGSLRVGDRILHPGDVSISGPHEAYGPHIAGPTGSLSVEIFTKASAVQPEIEGEPDEHDLAELARFQAAVDAWREKTSAA
jgi:hypothetical protein